MSRTQAREWLMRAVFQMEAQKDPSESAMQHLLQEERLSGKDREYITSTFRTLVQHLDEIDRNIDRYAKGWSVQRMPKADLAILRLAICEACYIKEIPASVAINEAVELAKKYGEANTPAFINGVAGKVLNAS